MSEVSRVVNSQLSANGLAANRPTNGTFPGQTYFATDTAVESVWTGVSWVLASPALTFNFNGTSYPDLTTLTLANGLTLTAASSTSTSGTLSTGEIVGVTFGGSLVNSIVAGANVDMSLSSGALTISSTAGDLACSGFSGVMSTGAPVSVSSVGQIIFAENVKLGFANSTNEIAVVLNTAYQSQPLPVEYTGGGNGCAIIYTEFFGLGGTLPSWFSITEAFAVGNLEVWEGTTTADMPLSGAIPPGTMDGDGVFIIITSPGSIVQSWGSVVGGAGSASSTFAVSISSYGRLYLQVIEANGAEAITLSGDIAFDTSYTALYAGSTGSNPPHETGALGIANAVPGTYSVTATTAGTFNSPLVVGHVVANHSPSSNIIIDVPPTELFSNSGTQICTDLLTLTGGPGLLVTGSSFSGTLTPYIILGGDTMIGTLGLAGGLALSGTAPSGLSLENTGVLGIVQNGTTQTGTVSVPGISLSGTSITNLVPGVGVAETVVSGVGTIWNTGVLAIGTGAGSINLGSGLALTSNTLSASGGVSFSGTNITDIIPEAGIGGVVSSGTLSLANTGVLGIVQSGTTQTGIVTITGGGSVSGTLGINYGGTIYSTLVAGTNATITPSGGAGGTLTVSASGGGGSSPYITPLIANFTAINVPAGGTAADTSTGLALFCPQTGTVVLQAYKYNTAPGSTFTATAGVNFSYTTGDQQVGIFVGDATGKIVNFDQSPADGASGYQYFNSAASYSSNPQNVSRQFWPTIFMRIRFDGTHFIMSAGADLNALVPLITISATTWIGTPTMVGISQMPYGGSPTSVFFHWSLTA